MSCPKCGDPRVWKNDLPLEDGRVLGGWTLGDEQDHITFCPFCGWDLTEPPPPPKA